LRVIVNSDKQARDKTGKQEVFQDENFRMKVTSSIKPVDKVVLSVDQDGSVCKSIEYTAKLIKEKYGENTKIVFGK
jgi:glycerol-3-phosphate cytidylyltransferase-like family protein